MSSTTIALILALVGLPLTVATLSWSALRWHRLRKRGLNGPKKLIARHNFITECARITKHSITLFGLFAVVFDWRLPWRIIEVRSLCLGLIGMILGLTSLWSLIGMFRLNGMLEDK